MHYVYVLTKKRNGTLYIGMTSDLVRRVYDRKNDLVEGFTKRYRVHRLVYYEMCQSIDGAITREKRLKKWKRKWKMRLIGEMNPEWRDLCDQLC